jgi:hypothetical protein
MKTIILTAAILFISAITAPYVSAQGCVAIKSTGGVCMMEHHPDSGSMSHKSWLFNANARYFKSFRHFRGDEEQKERLIENTEVINHQGTLDLALTRVFNQRWSVMVDVPLILNGRSSLYEHGRTSRHSMHSHGLGDIRLAAYRWLFNPQKSHNANVQLGLGIKLPTGNYKYRDFWQNVGPNGDQELRTVDQSIQLGDGGTGITAELNAFYNVRNNLGIYGNFFYLSNPREQNGVRTYRETVSPTLANEAIMSVPDQYMARVGANYSIESMGLVILGGMRLEGIPVYDLIGGSGFFRRPGYIISAEPGLNYSVKKLNIFATVPIALVRNRTQSVTDKENSKLRGTFVQGDAAFADYSINLGISRKF